LYPLLKKRQGEKRKMKNKELQDELTTVKRELEEVKELVRRQNFIIGINKVPWDKDFNWKSTIERK